MGCVGANSFARPVCAATAVRINSDLQRPTAPWANLFARDTTSPIQRALAEYHAGLHARNHPQTRILDRLRRAVGALRCIGVALLSRRAAADQPRRQNVARR